MIDASTAEANAHLLYHLKEGLGAKDFGSVSGFFEVAPKWRCPCCYRDKSEIARLDKNGDLLCALHLHHDHFEHVIAEKLPRRVVGDYIAAAAIEGSLVRFERVLICNDCNVAEPVAKKLVGAPEAFSFAPYEIASFIIVAKNVPHQVDPGRAQDAYEAAVGIMRVLAGRLRAIVAAMNGEPTEFEPLAGPAMRVLKDLERQKKAAE